MQTAKTDETQPQGPASTGEKRAYTSSEVLFLEVIEVARRRSWEKFAISLIKYRAKQQAELLDYWRRSATVAALIDEDESGAGGEADNAANDRAALSERLARALSSAAQLNESIQKLSDSAEMAEIDRHAANLLEQHAVAMKRLPDSLREAIDWDQADCHRRFMLAGKAVPNRHEARGLDEFAGPSGGRLHECAVTGLAISGGGVRSASFGLGALQALAQPGFLRVFDFVSGVSGGGWAAGWLSAWAHRHETGISGVEDELFRRRRFDSAPLRWVRRHIAYLAPRPGLASGDTWALLVAYASNWVPILTLVAVAIFAATLLPHFFSATANWLESSASGGWHTAAKWGTAMSVAAFVVLVRRLTLWYREPGVRVRPSPALFFVVVGFALLSTGSVALYLPVFRTSAELANIELMSEEFFGVLKEVAGYWASLNAAAVTLAWSLTTRPGLWVVDQIRTMFRQPNIRSGAIRRHRSSLGSEGASLLASTLLFALLFTGLMILSAKAKVSPGMRLAYGPLVIVGIFSLSELFMFTKRRDVDRAWIARLGAWIIAAILSWTLLCTLALGLTSLWRDPGRRDLANLIAAVTLGLLICSAWIASKRSSESRNVVALWACLAVLTPAVPIACSYVVRDGVGHLLPAGAIFYWFIAAGACFFVLAAVCNVNRFSLHAIYRQGLVRTFLGASRMSLRNPLTAKGTPLQEEPSSSTPVEPYAHDTKRTQMRRPAPTTNIDDSDDPQLAWLASTQKRPLPVLLFNAAVNGTSKTDLDGRAPRQWPFTFSQYFSGSPATGIGYASTADFFADGRETDESSGITLGSAMAVSGAAMSPTSGNYTHPLRAFLLGALNARLGMWIGNPSVPKAVRRVKPTLGGVTILREMLGLRAQFDDWIHLSDGGHFENLGIYELVRRGCLRIIAIDASCDPKRNFDDLADAIRRARIDLDVDIYPRNVWDIRGPIKDDKQGEAKAWMWFEIDYGNGLRGRLLYVKPSVYHHELRQGADVHNYWRDVEAFPHESTMNQFFTERQMEAYRTLGEACMTDALEAVLGAEPEGAISDTPSDGTPHGRSQVAEPDPDAPPTQVLKPDLVRAEEVDRELKWLLISRF